MSLPRLEVVEGGLRVLDAVEAGGLLRPFDPAPVADRPSRDSVQIGRDRHLRVPPPLGFMNHACHPSVRIDVLSLQVVALRDLRPGDEVTFFYPSTEWSMAEPFACHCGASDCQGLVSGADRVPVPVLLQHELAPHILQLLGLDDRDSGLREDPAP